MRDVGRARIVPLDHLPDHVARCRRPRLVPTARRSHLCPHLPCPSGAHHHIVTFRDPDNIQLELFVREPLGD
jgi:hypothetical protein